jgi:hypothetical protein
MKAKAALKRVAEGGTAGEDGRQAIKDTLERAPIGSLLSAGGPFGLDNLSRSGMASAALPAVSSAVNANLAGIGLGAGVGGLGAFVQYAKGRESERGFEERIRQGAAQKLASNMPPFLKQDRPAKVKEIYRALKREHPEYSAEKKARIAIASGQKQASAPKLVGIPNMSDEEVRSIYNDFLRRADEQKQKMDSSSPGSLAHWWHSRLYKAHAADANSFVEKNASFTKNAEIEYRGRTFPGYNQPIDSDRPEKKKMVLAKKGDQVKLIHFGQKGYKHNYSDAAKKNYLTRSAGIRGKDGSLTANDKLSANYWARRELWPKNEPADGSAKNREKRASDVSIPEKGLRPGLLMNDLTQVMTPEDAQLVREKLPLYERSGLGLLPLSVIGAASGALLGNSLGEAIDLTKDMKTGTPAYVTGKKLRPVGAVIGGALFPAAAYLATTSGKYDQQTLQAAREAINKAREKRASDDDLGHGMELAGLGILAVPPAIHLGAKIPGVRKAAKPLSVYLKENHAIEDAVDLGGLGVLGVPAIKHFMDKRKKEKSS